MRGLRQTAVKEGRYADLLKHHTPQQVGRLFLISLRRRYLYCPVSKVANSSIKAFLYEAELHASGLAQHADGLTTAKVHNLVYGPLILPYQLPEDWLETILTSEEFFRFLFVRNPADRLVSCYLDRVLSPTSVPHRVVRDALRVETAQEISFADFVSVVAEQDVREMNPHWRPIYYEACCDWVKYDSILKFEDLQGELRGVLDRVYPKVADKIDLDRNMSPTKTGASDRAREFVTPDLKSKIETIYAKDYEAFGY